MSANLRALVSLPVAALMLGAAGCSSSASSPTSPAAPGRGATIQGTVETGAGASAAEVAAFSAAGALKVTLVGTGLSTTTDASGRFTLQGVTGSRATLRFQGAGTDATIELGGLVEGQTLTITVRVSGSQAVLVSPSSRGPGPTGTKVEFEGTVESVTPPTLKVSGRVVVTNADTRIKRGDRTITLADLKPTDKVEVEGLQQADATILAIKIKLEDDQDDEDQNEQEVEFKGLIDSVSPPNLVVAGRPVTTNASTRIRRGDQTVPLSNLKPREKVEVKGVRQPSGTILASRIKVEDDKNDDDDDDN